MDKGTRRIELDPTKVPGVFTESPAPQMRVERLLVETIEAIGRARVRDGQVPPAWRAAEGAIREAFHPSLRAVTAVAAPRALAGQMLLNRPEDEPRTTQAGLPSADRERAEQIEASLQATRRPRGWRVVVVEVRLAPDGRMESVRVLESSGNAQFDETALAATKEEVGRHPLTNVGVLRVARFRIAAARAIVPLDLNPVLGPGAKTVRGLAPKMRFRFDENTGNVKAEKPFSQEIHTAVQLISITPAP
jgi:TonB family protein